MKTRRRLVLGVCAALLAGCIDTSGPNGPVLSVSAIRLPSPSIAIGDVMRDSAGNPAPLSVTGFDGKGDTITTFTPIFVVNGRGMHLGAGNILVGDSIATSTVVGNVGGLQSAPASVFVTFAPDSAAGAATDTLRVVIGVSDTLKSVPLNVAVTGGNPVPGTSAGPARGGSAGYAVYYQILHAPPSIKADSAAAFLTDGKRASAADTTDASGVASRQVALVLHLVGEPGLLDGSAADSVVVQATVNARGAVLHPSAVLRFVIPVSR